MYSIDQIKQKIQKQPKQSLGFFPTPLHRLNNVSNDLGINLYIKREDLTGVNLFGGNKIRKLEYVLGDAVEQNADTIVTFGATQSNHAMQTVSACRQLGLDPVLVLAEIVKPDYQALRSNFLLDHIMDADVHTVEAGDLSIEDLTDKLTKLGESVVEQLSKNGKKVYPIPPGANNIEGAIGVLDAFIEIIEQSDQLNLKLDYLVHTTGTGGSLSGFALGRKLTQQEQLKIVSISAADVDSTYASKIAKTANNTAEKLGLNAIVGNEDLNILDSYVGPGYELPSTSGTEAIQYLARKEGILLDPVYSGKGFAGLIDQVKQGLIPQGANVVFVHTGGATALFAEKQIVGNVDQ